MSDNLNFIQPKDAWDKLSIAEKAKMMEVAINNGIYNLNDIRQKYNEYAEGGGISDEEYYSTMEKVAEDNYQKWGLGSPDEALVHALNDNTYNYRGYYDKYPQSEANADTHWTDEFKTAYHPTFSVESLYSGQESQYNPQGLYGGHWVGDKFIPAPWQRGPLVEAAMNEYANGGGIHIKPSHRGRLTELKKRTGKTEAELYNDGNPAHKKMVVFARSARKWKHGLGGDLNTYNYGNTFGGGGLFGNETVDTVASFLPIVGTAEDAYQFYKDPSWANAGWLALSLGSDIFTGGMAARGIKALRMANKAHDAAQAASRTARRTWEAGKAANTAQSGSVKGADMRRMINSVKAAGATRQAAIKRANDALFETGVAAGVDQGLNGFINAAQMDLLPTFGLQYEQKHGLGGNLFSGEEEGSQQMETGRGHAIYLNYPNAEGALTGAARIGGVDIGAAIGKATGIKGLPFGHAGVILVDENGNSDYYDYGRYKAGTDKHGVSTFGTIKKGKGNWRTKKLPAQKQGENDSVYVARIQGGLPDTEFGAYQAMSFPNINIEEARAYVTKQANDPNRRTYGAGNTCVDAAYRSIVPFIQDTKAVQKMLEPSVEEYNTEGYSPFAQFWSLFPWSVGNTSAKMRKVADKTYIMNKKK